MTNTVLLFDTTLRDGEQMPGISLNTDEKVQIAKQLERLGVDIIEAGFPVASPGDFASVAAVSRAVSRCSVCALARMTQRDIDRAWEALRYAQKPRLHVLGAASDLHLQYKLQMTREQALKRTREMVAYAKTFCQDIEFSPEDATRSDVEYLIDVYNAAIDAGATTINIPDTVGIATPDEFGRLVKTVLSRLHKPGEVTVSVHCHNDLGLGVANSLAGVTNGARQIECTINGFGERTGNAALEEIAMAIATRPDSFGGVKTGVHTQEIARTSALVSHLCGVRLWPTKPIVGENAFRHESGIHQAAMLKNPLTYQILRPEDVGLRQSQLVLGKLSGRHAFEEHLKQMGYFFDEEKLSELFAKFKVLADKKKEITDGDLEALIREKAELPEIFVLDYFHVTTGNTLLATATVRIKRDEQVFEEAACGDGPVAATFSAIERAIGFKLTLKQYAIQALTGGNDALGEAFVRFEGQAGSVTGRGVSTDVLEASARAYLAAINKYIYDYSSQD